MIHAVNDNYFRRSKVTAFIRRSPDRAGKRHSCSARCCWISPGLADLRTSARSYSQGSSRLPIPFEQENGFPWPTRLARAGSQPATLEFAKRARHRRLPLPRVLVYRPARRPRPIPVPSSRRRPRSRPCVTAKIASPFAKRHPPTASPSASFASADREPVRDRPEREQPTMTVRERLARDRSERDGGPIHHEGIPMARDRDRDRDTSPVVRES